MREMLTLEVPSGTRRRLEILGFLHGISGSEVIHFLIRDGLDVLERHRRYQTNRLAVLSKAVAEGMTG